MKKYIAAILAVTAIVSSVALTSCSSSGNEDETTPNTAETTSPETDAETVTEAETSLPTPEDVEVIDFEVLTLEKDPVYENGTFVLYFTDHDVIYDENTVVNIGVVAEDEAYTVKGTIDFTTYPDMKVDDNNYCGIALSPAFEIDSGEYRFSITFDDYKVESTWLYNLPRIHSRTYG
mgnify:FL=1